MTVTLLLFAACADFKLGGNTDARAALENVEPGTLRLDVSPADDALGLLPQSFILAPDDYRAAKQIEHALSATVIVEGQLSAEVLQGWVAASSSSGPLSALVSAERPGLSQGGAVTTDEEGRFRLALPGAQPYNITVKPVDSTQTPLVVYENLGVGTGLTIEDVISGGAPRYGRVTADGDAPAGGVALHLVRTDTGSRSATFYSDINGWYLARVEAGQAYELVVEGTTEPKEGPIPTQNLPVTVEDAEGAQFDVGVGARVAVSVNLIAERDAERDADRRVPNPRARATSESLDLGSLVVEFEGQDNGVLTLTLTPGTWTVEILPGDSPSEAVPALSPYVYEGLEVKKDRNLGTVTLKDPVRLTGVVRDATDDHAPAAGVAVTAIATGYGGYASTTLTDSDGRYALEVPRTTLRIEATPAQPDMGAYTFDWTDTSDGSVSLDIDLPSGTSLSGILLSDGTPVPYAEVLVYDHAEGLLVARTLTGADGTYSVRVDVDADGGTDTAGDTGP